MENFASFHVFFVVNSVKFFMLLNIISGIFNVQFQFLPQAVEAHGCNMITLQLVLLLVMSTERVL